MLEAPVLIQSLKLSNNHTVAITWTTWEFLVLLALVLILMLLRTKWTALNLDPLLVVICHTGSCLK